MLDLLRFKTLLISVLALIGLIGGIRFYIHHKIDDGIKQGLEIAKLEEKLEYQNQFIASKALNIEAYKKALPEIEKSIIKKYKKIEIEDKDCQSQLKGIKDALDLFYNPPDST
ncbi:hypothetical protein [Helicobacter sp. 13S00477-4]|uniref:hypothetical protein n=1 Tax=Helicobacter sp. 13S00477-4 TaxID=1905759 RepID=UPI000BA5A0F4|nr:hypothetical protein [Helicobacter sp. 13S00477-4]PAF51285.1 hypothetical protein BKH44_06150 [Helicobacter sp. 13S00477-4]